MSIDFIVFIDTYIHGMGEPRKPPKLVPHENNDLTVFNLVSRTAVYNGEQAKSSRVQHNPQLM